MLGLIRSLSARSGPDSTSVTELARAIIGEISCEASRAILEKLFALRLCRVATSCSKSK